MSSTTPGAHWQSDELVASYAERREILLPLLDIQEDVMRRLLERHHRPVARFLDVGAGDGALSALVFGCHPRARGVLLDNSEPMLARAEQRFASGELRWEPVRADLSRPAWRAALPAGRFDLIVSGLAIHHLPAARKRELFAELFELLEPGGLFVNMEYVATSGPLQGLFDEEMRAKALDFERAQGGARHAHEVDLQDDHDFPDTAADQLEWLRAAGFRETEIHFKWAEAAIYGGSRPEGAS
jgi:SAM-dependent methyltransferase